MPKRRTDKGCVFRLGMRCMRWWWWWYKHSWIHGNPLQHSMAFLNPIRRKSKESQVFTVRRHGTMNLQQAAFKPACVIVVANVWLFQNDADQQCLPTGYTYFLLTGCCSCSVWCTVLYGWLLWGIETKGESSLNIRAPSSPWCSEKVTWSWHIRWETFVEANSEVLKLKDPLSDWFLLLGPWLVGKE